MRTTKKELYYYGAFFGWVGGFATAATLYAIPQNSHMHFLPGLFLIGMAAIVIHEYGTYFDDIQHHTLDPVKFTEKLKWLLVDRHEQDRRNGAVSNETEFVELIDPDGGPDRD